MKRYEAIFFDLDHTLWDFEKNSYATLKELVDKYQIHTVAGFEFESFYYNFKNSNRHLWSLYDKNLISQQELRHQRVHLTFAGLDVDINKYYEAFSTEYIHLCSTKGELIEHSIELLEHVFDRYKLLILTNGFEKVQYTKMITSNIFHYFDHVITTEDMNAKKPEPVFFEYALKKAGLKAENVIMVGDTLETDVLGALNAGIDAVYYNPDKTPHKHAVTHEVHSLKELLKLL